jgi:PqqD family protein of HPr-rel-A system
VRLFRLRGAETPKCVPFDDAVVVFNPTTWDTHLLNPAAAIVLDALAVRPRTRADVAQLLMHEPDGNGDEPGADDVIEQLCDVQLIEPVDDAAPGQPERR